MVFTVSGKDGKSTEVPLDPNRKNETGAYYGFTCYVNSIQMADTITAVFHYGENGEEKTVETTYSVKQYLDVIENSTEFDEKVKTLGRAIRDYGHYAQLFLAPVHGFRVGEGLDHETIEGSGTAYSASDYEAALSDEAVAPVSINPSNAGSAIKKVTYSLHLESATGIYLYLKPADGFEGTPAVTVDGTDSEAELLDDGRYRVSIAGISPHQLGKTYRVKVSAGGSSFEISISALSYVHAVLSSESMSEDAKNAAAAIWKYYTSARAYNAQEEQG